MGIGQKRPVQSICLSGLKTRGACAITGRRYPTPQRPVKDTDWSCMSMSADTTGTRRGGIVARLTLAVSLASVVPLVVAAYGLYGAPSSLTATGWLLTVAVACAMAGAI